MHPGFMEKILFYLQPQTIRNNPKAFEWIFLKYRILSDGLSEKGIQSAFLMDDGLKGAYPDDTQNLFSPSDFGMRFSRKDWPHFWADVLTDEHMEEKERLLDALYEAYRFEIVICWNYDATLDRFCMEKGIITIYQELGLIREPMLYQMDFEGLLWKSSLPRLYKKFKDNLRGDDPRLKAFLKRFRSGVKYSKNEIMKELNLDSRKPIMLIPLQVEDDSNIIVGSPFKTMADFVYFCLNSIDDINSYNMIIKRHPGQPDVVINLSRERGGLTDFPCHSEGKFFPDKIPIILNEFDSLSLINASDYIITINSSMGFEGLCFEKKVFTVGKSPYCGMEFTADLDSRSTYRIKDYNPFFEDLYVEKLKGLRNFLYFTIFNYHLAEDDIINPDYYLNLFRLPNEANDRDRIYLSHKRYSMVNLEWTGERYIPWMEGSEIHYEHLHRYRFAKEFVKDKKVLDLACGEGYGSFMLSEEADEVIGVDIDKVTTRHASSRYINKNLKFIEGSITDVPVKGEKIFDVVVCFEAIEHITEHDKLMSEVKRLIKEDGVFIVSTPNKYVYSSQPNFQNLFHLKELYFDEFKALLDHNFKNTLFYGQKVYPSSNIFPLSSFSGITSQYVIEKGEKDFLFTQPEKKQALYFIAISSNGPLEGVISNSYLVDISETLFKLKDIHISNLESKAREKDSHIMNLEAAIKDKDTHIGNLERQREESYRDWQTHVKSLERMLQEREGNIQNLEAALKDKEAHIENLEHQREENFQNWQTHEKNLRDIIQDKQIQIENLERQREENYRDWQTHEKNLEAIIEDKQTHIGNLEAAISDKDAYIVNLETALKGKGATLNYIYNSYGLGSLLVCNKMIDKVFPTNSRRRLLAKNILDAIKNPKHFLKRI
jgi:2-polyprenyl-3-methyl-5-hydroxy-6-metoxy-1,4-benzoquinol methylase